MSVLDFENDVGSSGAEERGRMLMWGGGGRGGMTLLLLRLLMLLRSVNRCQRLGKSGEHVRGC